LQAGDWATFRTASGDLVTGIVFAVVNVGAYYVLADHGRTCASYDDGLFRFLERDIVR